MIAISKEGDTWTVVYIKVVGDWTYREEVTTTSKEEAIDAVNRIAADYL